MGVHFITKLFCVWFHQLVFLEIGVLFVLSGSLEHSCKVFLHFEVICGNVFLKHCIRYDFVLGLRSRLSL